MKFDITINGLEILFLDANMVGISYRDSISHKLSEANRLLNTMTSGSADSDYQEFSTLLADALSQFTELRCIARVLGNES